MKQKKELAVLVVLLLILGAVGYFYFDRDKPVVTADAGSGAQNYQLLPVDNLSLHNAGVEKARKTEYKGGGRNIFSRELPPPPPPQGPHYDKNHPAPSPPPHPTHCQPGHRTEHPDRRPPRKRKRDDLARQAIHPRRETLLPQNGTVSD